MKTCTARMAVLVAAAVITLVGSAFAGQTQAERERVLRQRADPESALGWQIAPAKETPRGRPNPIETEGRSWDGNCHCGDQRN